MNAQETMNYHYVDSLTLSYYNSGEWNKLIEVGQHAIAEGIDYKYLRQRLGYSFFSRGDYFNAKFHFEKALSFDSFNSFTLEYLYYSYLYTGREEYAGFLARRLNSELKKALSVNSFEPLESIELEYNYKFAATIHRSDPQYYRLGINSKIGYRLTLSQSFSNYKQVLFTQPIDIYETISVRQPEYYGLLKYSASNHFLLKTAYHFIDTPSDTTVNNGNLIYFAFSKDLNRFSIETYGSILSFGQELTYQTGILTGFIFPGQSSFILTGTVSGLFQQNNSRVIYNQKAELKVHKKTWIEGSLTFGRMIDYNDYNGLYVYNSIDPLTFRSGATLVYYLNRKIALWANFSFEQKEYLENSSFHYNQFSYLGGIKWKL
jgi:hypothetical protein